MPQMCCDQSTHHFIIISSWSYHHSSQLVSSLDPRLKRPYSKNVQKVWFNSKEIFEKTLKFVSYLYSLCSQCFLIFWNGFQSVESKTGTLLMYRAGGLQAGGSFLSYFVTWQHNITRQMKETAMSGIRTQDVNNSDSGPWNIWCRNLIYFKSPTVLRLSSTKQWNFKLRSELKVTVTEEHFVFSDQSYVCDQGAVTM